MLSSVSGERKFKSKTFKELNVKSNTMKHFRYVALPKRKLKKMASLCCEDEQRS